jgi:hypothetical protein
MKKIGTLLLLCTFSLMLLAQQKDSSSLANVDLAKYNKERILMTRNSMYVLGGWSALNIVSGSIGWSKGKDSNRFFHQGNVFWNIVNLGIAIPSLLTIKKSVHKSYNEQETLKYQKGSEVTYLVNLGLDLGYMLGGAALYDYASRNPSKKGATRMNGFGQSLLMQGGFLLLFDATMYSFHKSHSQQLTGGKYMGDLAFTGNGFAYSYHF